VPELRVFAPEGVGEIRRGDDLAALLVAALADQRSKDSERSSPDLTDGDVVLVTSKAVSKAEGRVVPGTREEHLPAETTRVVARRGPTQIVRTHHGLTLAAAGIDASNVERGSVVLLPIDPDASARALRSRLRELTGRNVGVVVTDTAGRPWRDGQTDIAVGAAGLKVLEDFAGRRDDYGNDLVVTAPAVADELAGAAELAQGKLGGRPFAVARGRADLVLPVGDDGSGARTLVRPDGSDLFGFGAREAVLRALLGDPADAAAFGAPSDAADLAELVEQLGGTLRNQDGAWVVSGEVDPTALRALAFAHGWELEPNDSRGVRLRPRGTSP
jgi:coenzyme F420-0:L-glutamate ligase/coenzyme F420-1:gamma-L-glutamate ligase